MLVWLAIRLLPTLRREPPACLPALSFVPHSRVTLLKHKSKPANGIKILFTCSPSTAASLMVSQGLSSCCSQPKEGLPQETCRAGSFPPLPAPPPAQVHAQRLRPERQSSYLPHLLHTTSPHHGLLPTHSFSPFDVLPPPGSVSGFLFGVCPSVSLSHWKGTPESWSLWSSSIENKHLPHGRCSASTR